MSRVPAASVAEAADSPDRSLYRAIWRWHFYAGLLTIPFMLLLGVTGALYLFKPDINATVFAYRTIVPAHAEAALPPGKLVADALAAVPGSRPVAYRTPADATASAVVTVDDAGTDRLVYLDPANGRVLGTVGKTEEFNQVVRKLHSLEYIGKKPKLVIEAVGGFTLMLVVSGVYLWWPRGRTGGVVSVRGTPARRVFWRDLHAVSGAVTAVLVLFLAATGMFWTSYWGDKFNQFAARIGQGFPVTMWDDVPTSTVPAKDALGQVGWTVENSPMATSTPTEGATPIGIDKAVAIAAARGISPGFEVAYPDGPTGVYTASIFPIEAPSRERMIHIDQYSGKPLVDVGFADYGLLAKSVEVGTDIHMGQMFGRFNQVLMLLAAFAVLLSSVSAVVMWWKRRPTGRLGVPPYPASRRVYIALWIIAIVFGVVFPISGVAILLMLAFDLLVVRTIPPLRRAFA
jgi:uncharacterized iron-regulated membrane protein